MSASATAIGRGRMQKPKAGKNIQQPIRESLNGGSLYFIMHNKQRNDSMSKRLILWTLLLIPFLLAAQDMKSMELDNLKGDTFVLKDHLNADATIVSFWATWCLPCQKEHPALQEVKNFFQKKNKTIQVIAISTDSPRSLAKVKKYVRSHRKYKFVFLIDPDREFSQQLLVTEIPHTFVLDKNGKVIYEHTGYRKGDEKELISVLEKYFSKQKK